MKHKRGTAEWFKQVEYIPFDFSSFNASVNYYDFFSSPDLMIHLAWEGLPNYTSDFHLRSIFPGILPF